ncbi:MAG: FemAB family PEP-CTERM system-associated protein [Phycisphaerae bacterium]|nr:FemAB family PEP-CTERM system-associated protein [Phycisphaerae bacterium]
MTRTRPEFIVFSDDWGRHPSSCQHLFGRISRRHRVLWVDTIGLRSAKADSFTLFRGLEKLRKWARPLRRVSENMWVLAPIMLPAAGEDFLARVNGRLVATAIRRVTTRLGFRDPVMFTSVPTAVDYVGQLGESRVVYYVTDNYALWPGGNAEKIRAADRRLRDAADVVFPCTQALCETACEKSTLLPHAVDFDHFTTPAPEPPDLAAIPHPRVCFFGLIYEKIDLPLLAKLAAARPDVHVVLIGPVKTDVSILAPHANVHLLGPKPYDKLPGYLQAMDAVVVPYVPDDEKLQCGPLKIRECLAVGKPTVLQNIPDLRQFADVVRLYDSPDQFIAQVDAALGCSTGVPPVSRMGVSPMLRSDALANAMRQRVQGQTWDARADLVLDTLAKLEPAAAPTAAKRLTISLAREVPEWSPLLDQQAAGVFHDPRWGVVMRQAYGNEPYYLTASVGREPVAALQLVRQASTVFGTRLCSLPYFDSADILSRDPDATAMLLTQAANLREKTASRWVELRLSNPLPKLPTRDDKVTMHLPLPADPAVLWDQLKAKVRNQIRKAQKADLRAVHGGGELLEPFHTVYLRTMRDLGSPSHSRTFFELILRHFPEAARVFVVYQGRRPLAASLTLRDRHALRVPWAGSDWRFSPLCANMLLYWAMLEHGCRDGAPTFDFGRGTRDGGTYQFKKQWGSIEVPLYWQYLLAEGDTLPELRHDSPRYQKAVEVWKRLPLTTVRHLGPLIVRKLS